MGSALSAMRVTTMAERGFAAFPKPDVHAVLDDTTEGHHDDADTAVVVVFSRTVGPLQQAAITGWAELAGEAHAATPPALPVMVAAMLRRPALDAFLERAAEGLASGRSASAASAGVFFPLFAELPGPILGNFRAREELVPGNGLGCAGTRAEEVLRHGLTDENSIFAVEDHGGRQYSIFSTPCAALAVLAVHGDLADALLLVPQLTSEAPEDVAARCPRNGTRWLCLSPSAGRRISTAIGIIPSTTKSTIAGRADAAAFVSMQLLANRDPTNAAVAWAGIEWPQRAFRSTLNATGRDAVHDPTAGGPALAALDALLKYTTRPAGSGAVAPATNDPDGTGLDAVMSTFVRCRALQAEGQEHMTAGAGDARAVLATLTTAATPAQYLKAIRALATTASSSSTSATAAACSDEDDDDGDHFASAPKPAARFSDGLRHLIGVDAADLAAAVWATSATPQCSGADRSTSLLRPLISALFQFERGRQIARHGTDQGGTGGYVSHTRAMLPTRELLIPAWGPESGGEDDAAVVVRSAGDSVAAVFPSRAHIVFQSMWRPEAAGKPATNGRSAFMAAWAGLTAGVLDAWPFWPHTMAVGGAVAWCLDPSHQQQHHRRRDGHEGDDEAAAAGEAWGDEGDDNRPADIDLLFHSVTPEGAAVLRSKLVEHCHAFAEREGSCPPPAVLVTSRTMTIVFGSPQLPRIQLAFGRWECQADCLQTADVDCCCAGFDGTTALLTARGALAWSLRANVPNRARHDVRGSPTYEMRLWKYARRHGFAVLDMAQTTDCPALKYHRAAIEEAAGNERDRRKQHRGEEKKIKNAHRQRRAIATSAEGIMWLLHVDEGTFVPTEPKDALKVTPTMPLATIMKRVTKAGYVESDNYGTHEEGYVVVEDDGPPIACVFDATKHDLRSPGGAAALSLRADGGGSGAVMADSMARSTLPADVSLGMLDTDRVKMAAAAGNAHYDQVHRDVWRVRPVAAASS